MPIPHALLTLLLSCGAPDRAEQFSSPTQDGKFLFYGLCHELGHVIAMWGDRKLEEDHHAWAHYTGVVLVEHLSDTVKADWIRRCSSSCTSSSGRRRSAT